MMDVKVHDRDYKLLTNRAQGPYREMLARCHCGTDRAALGLHKNHVTYVPRTNIPRYGLGQILTVSITLSGHVFLLNLPDFQNKKYYAFDSVSIETVRRGYILTKDLPQDYLAIK